MVGRVKIRTRILRVLNSRPVWLGYGSLVSVLVLWVGGTFESLHTDIPITRARPLSGWSTGDVHSHPSGDTDLQAHPRCRAEDGDRGYLTERQCARRLVALMLEVADERGLDWLIFSDHGPWLGGLFNYNDAKARREWRMMKNASDELSVKYGTHALMGQELGSAPPFSSYGHFNAYQIDDYVRNSSREVPDSHYIQDVADAGGFGAINHPYLKGLAWDCWYRNSRPGCRRGAVEFAQTPSRPNRAATLVAMEITYGGRFPAEATLSRWDEMLEKGYRISPVGASDAHAWSRGGDSYRHSLGRPGEWKLGSSRTFVYTGEYPTPSTDYDSTDRQEPVRQALLAGRTVASNAGFATVQMANAIPGGTVTVAEPGGIGIETLITYEAAFAPGGQPPDLIRVIVSQLGDECGRGCEKVTQTFTPAPTEEAYGQLSTTIEFPDGWDHAYVRVEVLESAPAAESPRFGAFTSPIFLERVQPLT